MPGEVGGYARTGLDEAGLGTGTGVLVLTACALAVGAGAGYAVNRDDSPVVHACYRVAKDGSPANGATLRAVSASATCRRNERPLTWNLRGPQGPGPGADGAAGSGRTRRACRSPPGLRRAAATSSGASPRPCRASRRRPNCAPPPPCNDDGFEPNDSLAQAIARRSRHDDLGASPAPATTTTSRRRRQARIVTATLTFDTTPCSRSPCSTARAPRSRARPGSSPQTVTHAGRGHGHRVRAGARRGQRAGRVHALPLRLDGNQRAARGGQRATDLEEARVPLVPHPFARARRARRRALPSRSRSRCAAAPALKRRSPPPRRRPAPPSRRPTARSRSPARATSTCSPTPRVDQRVRARRRRIERRSPGRRLGQDEGRPAGAALARLGAHRRRRSRDPGRQHLARLGARGPLHQRPVAERHDSRPGALGRRDGRRHRGGRRFRRRPVLLAGRAVRRLPRRAAQRARRRPLQGRRGCGGDGRAHPRHDDDLREQRRGRPDHVRRATPRARPRAPPRRCRSAP